ncbi:ATP-binding cassette domain-containing protein [Streptosporangium sp. CA-115845]|uniref:ATP-binding cassette domain-containing protein n=1 Tax=Streptosporangium sp. CA-115845 TaxID=3240071 RepID=UPI003D89DD3F
MLPASTGAGAVAGVGHKADRRPHRLSGGGRRRIGIARPLTAGPSLPLVDEPTAAPMPSP